MLQNLLALGVVLILVLFLEPGADLRPGALRPYQSQAGIQPIPAGAALFGSQDFHLLTGLKRVIQGYKFIVDFGAAGAVPNIGMYMIRKVNRSGPGWEI